MSTPLRHLPELCDSQLLRIKVLERILNDIINKDTSRESEEERARFCQAMKTHLENFADDRLVDMASGRSVTVAERMLNCGGMMIDMWMRCATWRDADVLRRIGGKPAGRYLFDAIMLHLLQEEEAYMWNLANSEAHYEDKTKAYKRSRSGSVANFIRTERGTYGEAYRYVDMALVDQLIVVLNEAAETYAAAKTSYNNFLSIVYGKGAATSPWGKVREHFVDTKLMFDTYEREGEKAAKRAKKEAMERAALRAAMGLPPRK